ncbi:hypothetical protein A6A27_11815 [Micromonospora sp. CB01531]|nr:hypothetical protein A6A27_11815 [Micromonospora sp. CB01531]
MQIGTNTRACTDRIVRVWDMATPVDVARGAEWYADAGRICTEQAEATGYSRETVAAVISHLSPRTSWSRNVAGAISLLHGGDAAGCIGDNIKRARRALVSPTPLETFGPDAPKTRRFARNILGDRDQVTVDVWAARVAFGDRFDDPETVLGWVNVYDAVEHAYRLAAQRAGVDPTTMQATTWIVARNGRAD